MRCSAPAAGRPWYCSCQPGCCRVPRPAAAADAQPPLLPPPLLIPALPLAPPAAADSQLEEPSPKSVCGYDFGEEVEQEAELRMDHTAWQEVCATD